MCGNRTSFLTPLVSDSDSEVGVMRGTPRRPRAGGLLSKEFRIALCANGDYSRRNEMFSFARIDADTVEMLFTACCKDDMHP